MSLKSSLSDVFEQDVTCCLHLRWLAGYAKPCERPTQSPTICFPPSLHLRPVPWCTFPSQVNIRVTGEHFLTILGPRTRWKSWSSQSLTILSFSSDLTQPFTQYGSSAGRLEPWSARSPTWSLNPSTWSSGGRWYKIENKRKMTKTQKTEINNNRHRFQNLNLIISQSTPRLDGCKGPWVFSIVSFSINDEILKFIHLKMLTWCTMYIHTSSSTSTLTSPTKHQNIWSLI